MSNTTLQARIATHTKYAVECEGLASAAHGVGDRLACDSYAQSAAWHRDQARILAESVCTSPAA